MTRASGSHAEMTVRPMRETDIPRVFAIEQQAYPFPWRKNIFHDCLRAGLPGWILQVDNEIGGYALLSVAVGEAHLLNLCIRPVLQRRGLGGWFLDWLIAEASRQGAEVMFLEVRPSNPAAIELYASRGFEKIGARPGYYRAGTLREDAIVMARQPLLTG